MPKSGPEFSARMDKLLEEGRVPGGIVRRATESIAILTHGSDPMDTKQYLSNSYWRWVTDRQSETPRLRKLRGGLR